MKREFNLLIERKKMHHKHNRTLYIKTLKNKSPNLSVYVHKNAAGNSFGGDPRAEFWPTMSIL